MGLKGQRDQFAEAHLSAPALFTHHLRSERQASQELSCSHNTTVIHIGGGETEGSLWWSVPSYQQCSLSYSSSAGPRRPADKKASTQEGLYFRDSVAFSFDGADFKKFFFADGS